MKWYQCISKCCFFALKGQCHKIFASGFFHESSFSKPLKIRLGSFQTFQKILLGYFCKSRYTTGINDTDGKLALVSTTPVANLQRQISSANPQIRKFSCKVRKILKKDISFSLSYGGKFVDLHLVDWLTYKICEFAICRSIKINTQIWNLWICNCKLSQRVCGFAICEFKKTFVPIIVVRLPTSLFYIERDPHSRMEIWERET